MENIVKLVCPSKGRADNVITKDLLPGIVLVVPESEVNDYREHNPDNEVVGTPKTVNNIVRARQFILDMWDNVFMVDDDIYKIKRNYADIGEDLYVENAKELYDIIQWTADIARQIGSKVFGFVSYRRPNLYESFDPFKTTGYMNSSHIGFLKGHGLRYSLDFEEAEDHYMSCLQIYKNRYAFINSMISFFTKDNFKAQGGCNDTRTVEVMKKNTMLLRKTFGSVVRMKGTTGMKRKVNEGERSLSFPY